MENIAMIYKHFLDINEGTWGGGGAAANVAQVPAAYFVVHTNTLR